MARTVPYPAIEDVQGCTDVESALRWNRFLPSPTNDDERMVIDAVMAKLKELREQDNAAYVRASKNLGWD